MRKEGNFCHIAWGCWTITSLLLTQKCVLPGTVMLALNKMKLPNPKVPSKKRESNVVISKQWCNLAVKVVIRQLNVNVIIFSHQESTILRAQCKKHYILVS